MFRGNSGRIDAFMSELRALQPYNGVSFRGLRIIGGASPEGNTDFQKVLSARRGEHVASLLESYGLRGVYPVEFASLGIDWEGLARLVERSAMPYRSAVLDILYHTPEWIKRDGKVVDGRKRQLQMVAGGRAWHYMEAHFFPELRRARVEYLYSGAAPRPAAAGRVDTIVVSRRDTVVVVRKDTVVVVQRDTVVASPSRPKYPFYMSLKTNLLYDVALVPNVGAEFYLGRGWSLGGSWMYAWWSSDKRHRYWRTYGGELNLRKYFGRRASEKPLTGHHLGLYGQMLTYDFETVPVETELRRRHRIRLFAAGGSSFESGFQRRCGLSRRRVQEIRPRRRPLCLERDATAALVRAHESGNFADMAARSREQQ